MIEVNFLSGENEITTKTLTQWNKGQTLSAIVCSKYFLFNKSNNFSLGYCIVIKKVLK